MSSILSSRLTFGNRSLSQRKRGFALLITITLLAFLVLLLVSLAALTRVETQVASNSQSVAQARQNAVMALNIAVGQLQKYAGPDSAVTGTAELISKTAVQNPAFTAIWNATTAGVEPAMYLVSGSEVKDAVASDVFAATDPSVDIASGTESTSSQVFLIGNQSVAVDPASPTSDEKKMRIKVAKQDIRAAAGTVPGMGAATPLVGRYGWWVGDQGAKASLVLPDQSARVNYAPWTGSSGSRIRQQIGVGPSYFRNATATNQLGAKEGFDPFSNTGFGNLVTKEQLGMMSVAGAAGQMVGQSSFLKNHFHDFTTTSYSVLANTLPASNPNRGLLTDLSLNPGALGTAFAAYADYANYMEAPGSTITGATVATPAITSVDSMRRRYKMMPPVNNAAAGLPDITFSTLPVLSGFYYQFGISRANASSFNLQSRLFVSLWNPYSTALAPSNLNGLSIDVVLPTITADGQSIDLNQLPASRASGGVLLPYGATYRHNDSAGGSPPYGSSAEMASWLPGRVYSWCTNLPAAANSATSLGFYSNLLQSSWTRSVAGAPANPYPALEIPASTVTVRVKLNGVVVSTYDVKFDQQSDGPGSQIWRFGFAFRINQPQGISLNRTWLKEFDPRQPLFTQADVPSNTATSKTFLPFYTDSATSSAPLLYSDTSAKISSISLGNYLVMPLLYRVQGQKASAMSVFNDASLFELPRSPLLSLGELQHLQVTGKRPYSIGNSWGDTANVVYDRFFFSGVPATGTHPILSPGASEPLPNWNMRTFGASSVAELRSDSNPADAGLSSRYILQGGGFNINSTSAPAWRAVLSSLRFSAAAPFTAAGMDNTMSNSSLNAGTQDGTTMQSQTFNSDTSIGAAPSAAPAPVFFRFPQSAQEVFYWDKPSQSGTNERQFITSAFRVGVRGYNNSTVTKGFTGETGTTWPVATAKTGTRRQDLTTDQIELLAREIVTRIRIRSSTKGPFRSLQEFLSEVDSGTKESLLEASITAAGLNSNQILPVTPVALPAYPGFSTLTLTQADILNVLAPYLRNRSDTFIVRTYGEVINPVTGTVDAKAWAEATIQRFPETVASGDSITQPAQPFGRRFKITNFRWLTSTDI